MAQRSTQRTTLRPAVGEAATPYERAAGVACAEEAAAAPAPTLLLGRYSVLEVRASGGFGQVDVCWDTRLQRRVAIKRIPLFPTSDDVPTTSAADAIGEARIACMLAHPNIVTVHDFEIEGDYAHIVMEYVDGVSLAELLQRVEGGTLTCDETAYVLDAVAAALAYAHENGVLHLDIKPSNILIDRSGVVKLSDFGMAALASGAGWGGARGGTVGYMPAEQIMGELVDERCDVFALAAVAWEALTGRAPFDAKSPEASLAKVRKGPSPKLSRLDPSLAGGVEQVMSEALAPFPEQRIPDVGDLADALVPALGDPEAGEASVRQLLAQLSDDEVACGLAGTPLPLAVRAPWLGDACLRALTALVCAVVGFRLLGPVTNRLLGGGRVVATLACGVAGAAWPPLGSALVSAGLSASLALVSPDPATAPQRVAAAVLLLAALAAWWVPARRSRCGSAALLAGVATGTPVCSAALCGLVAGPLVAGATGALSCLLMLACPVAAEVGYDLGRLASALPPVLADPAALVLVAGCALAGCLASLLVGRGGTGTAVLGEVVAAGGAVAAQVAAGAMENGGIWELPDPASVALAIGCVVFLSLSLATFGVPEDAAEVR